MTEPSINNSSNTARPAKFTLSEDWLATLIGLAIVLIIALGVIGPGPQTLRLAAGAGETASLDIPAVGGWQVSVSMAGESASLAESSANVVDVQGGAGYTFICGRGVVLALEEANGLDGLEAGQARLFLDNQCESEVIITYRHGYAIPWPLFNLFVR